jgi:hypothetical protein
VKQPAVEQLILAHGTRGIERLARYLPPDYAARAAWALWRSPDVLITTGFYVDGHPETDGPPGAFFLGRALAEQGASVSFVGERYVLALLKEMVEELWRPEPALSVDSRSPEPAKGKGPVAGAHHSGSNSDPDFIEFPVADAATSRALSQEIISNLQPSAVVAIERCGRTGSGHYRNMLGTEITPFTAQIDDLFASATGDPGVVRVGVGDGGNEIGMGSLADYIPTELGIADPVATRVDHLVLATVSNWGVYGIIAYLSRLAGSDLLPVEGEEARTLEMMVALGAIDGLTRRAEPSVDGFSLEATSALIAALRRAVL